MTLEIKYLDHTVPCNPGETVLNALERGGVLVPSSCRAGACQFCMLRVVEGEVPKAAQEGIKPMLRQTGHFLSCICKPTQSLQCEPANAAAFRQYVTVDSVRKVSGDVAIVRFLRPTAFQFSPGQFVTFKTEQGVARSYSLASRADANHFEIHVRRVVNGQLSAWFHDAANAGDKLWMEGPKGDCVYYPEKPDEPLTLIGTGTGIAPLFAVVEEAVRKGHRGPISVYNGALSADRFYLAEALRMLAARYENVRYVPCALQGHPTGDLRVGDLPQIVLNELTEAKAQRIYLCGDPGVVRVLKKRLFLAGASLGRIHADPFV